MAGGTNEAFVLDTSAALAWLFEDELDDTARAMAVAVSAHGAAVPMLFRWEMQNALTSAMRRGRISEEIVRARCADIDDLRLLVDAQVVNTSHGTGLDLALRFDLSAYDACYLEMAIRLRRSLMTRDRRLASAAEAMDVLWHP